MYESKKGGMEGGPGGERAHLGALAVHAVRAASRPTRSYIKH